MSVAERFSDPQRKRRVLYAVMGLLGAVFLSTLVLPVDETTARFLGTLSFGVMSGIWLAHLLYSI